MYQELLQTSFVAFVVAALSAPLAQHLARKLGCVDTPDNQRKLHSGNPPLAGGLLAFSGLCVAGMWAAISGQINWLSVLPLLAASATIMVVGLLDDRVALSSGKKLAGQSAAVTLLLFGGFEFHGLSLLGMPLDLGILESLIVAVLLLATINAFNFLDGADGFAGTVGLVISTTLCGLAVWSGQVLDAVLAASLAGALLGFLVFNFPPARLFMGDSGSMLVGLLLGCLIFRTSGQSQGPTPLGIAAALLALPCLDMSAAIARRKLTGRSMAAADRGHLHHCFARCGMGPRKVVFTAGVLCMIPAAGACIAIVSGIHAIAWLSIGMLVAILLMSRMFGGNELRLLLNRVVPQHLFRQGVSNTSRKTFVGLNHSEECIELYQMLSEFAASNELACVSMHLEGCWMKDGLDVFWESASPLVASQNWQARLPILSGKRLLGYVEVSGESSIDCVRKTLAPLQELVTRTIPAVEQLVDATPHRTAGQSTVLNERVDPIDDSPAITVCSQDEIEHRIDHHTGIVLIDDVVLPGIPASTAISG